MSALFVRRSLMALGASTLVVACGGDTRVNNLDTGISRDSALSVIAKDMKPGGGSDALPNVYTRDAYLVDGKNIEVLYYSANNAKAGKDTVPWKDLTPMVFIENKLIGKGWEYWDSLSTSKKIPLKKRD